MIARRPFVRLVLLIACAAIFVTVSLELLRRSESEALNGYDEMQYPKIISGVFVTGFEESSFFPSDTSIPDRNDPRRYRIDLVVDKEQRFKLHEQHPKAAYVAFHVTFLGRRTKYPVSIDCDGGRYYYFIPDLLLQTRYLGPIADPDMPVRGPPRPYQPFKRSGEGGRIRELEDRALAGCSR